MAEKMRERKLNILSGRVKAFSKKNADGATDHFLTGTASSTVRDRQGDIMDEACQQSMVKQARDLTMFVNHSYNIPEDILGTCTDASLVATGGVIDLEITVKIDSESPRAMQAWKSVHNGTKLGFSIGGALKDFDVDTTVETDSWMPPLIIHDLELFEISLVGIPANPRSYTRSLDADGNVVDFGFLRKIAHDTKRSIESAHPELVKAASTDSEARERLRELVKELAMPDDSKPDESTEEILEKIEEAADKVLPEVEPPADPTEGDPVEKSLVTGDVEKDEKLPTSAMNDHLQKCKTACAGALAFHKAAAATGVCGCGNSSMHDAHDAIHQAAVHASAGAEAEDPKPHFQACMKSIKEAMGHHVAAVQHGLCGDAQKAMIAAHKCFKDLQPDGAAMPNDGSDTPPSPAGGGAATGKSVDELETQKALVTAAKDEYLAIQGEIATAKAAYDESVAKIEALKTDLAELNAKIEIAKNTSLGRKTLAYPAVASPEGPDKILSVGVTNTRV